MPHENGANVPAMPSDDSSGTLPRKQSSGGAIYYRTVDTPSGPRELAYIIPATTFGDPIYTGTDDSTATADNESNTALL